MRGEGRRRFTLLDAMVLVAATAAGIAGARSYLAALVKCDEGLILAHFYRSEISAVAPCLFAWGLVVIVLRMIPPCLPFQEIVQQPGVAACLAATVASTFAGFDFLRSRFGPFQPSSLDWLLRIAWMDLPRRIVPAVAVAWLMIGLAGRWRRSPDWIDAAGRMLGVAWLALYLASKYPG